MDPIDVVLLTKDSERILENCLKSVYRNIPVRRLIVVDGYSSDSTIEILGRFNDDYKNVKIIYDRGTRATARQKGIENVETEWFLFVDSDVVLCRDWYGKALNYVNDDVGAVWGIEVWSTIRNQATLKMFLRITRKLFELRGGTHDTLIRTCLVKDIRIPRDLHVFEDAYVKDWITAKGYRAVACYDPYCIHFRPENVWTLKGSLSLIADAMRCGGLNLFFRLSLAYGFYTGYSMYQMLTNRNSRS